MSSCFARCLMLFAFFFLRDIAEAQESSASGQVDGIEASVSRSFQDVAKRRETIELGIERIKKLRAAGKRQEADELAKQVVPALLQDAETNLNNGQHDGAAAKLDQALLLTDKLRKSGDPTVRNRGTALEALALRFRALIADLQLKPDEAAEYYGRLGKLALKSDDPVLAAEALLNIAGAQKGMAEYEDAAKTYAKAEERARKIGDPLLLFRVLRERASLAQLTGDYIAAKTFLLWGTDNVAPTGDTKKRSSALSILKSSHPKSEAESNYIQQQLILVYIDLSLLELMTPFSCDRALRDSNKWLSEAEAVAESLGDPFRYNSVKSQRALIAGIGGRFGDALIHLQEAQNALAAREDPRFSEIKKPMEALNRAQTSYALSSLGRYKEAIAVATEAVELGGQLEDFMTRESVIEALGHALFLAGRRTEAEEPLRKALALIDYVRADISLPNEMRSQLASNYPETSQMLQAILIDQSRIEDALDVAESERRVTAFVQAASTDIVQPNRTDAHPYQPNSLNPREVSARLSSTLVVYAVIPDFRQWVTPGSIGGFHPAVEEEIFVWVVSPEGRIDFRRIPLHRRTADNQNAQPRDFWTDQCKKLAGLRGIVSGAHSSDVQVGDDARRRLYDLLIKPVAHLLPAEPSARVAFLPHGPLHNVPFSALTNDEGQRLIEKHTIFFAPSISFLDRVAQEGTEKEHQVRVTSGHNSLVAAVTEFSNKMVALPLAASEANTVAKRLGTTALIDADATLDAFASRLPSAKIVHLATHASADEETGQSQLWLAPDTNGNNVVLSGRRIAGMISRADLVTLSACETAGGRITSNGVMGMARAFLTAGADSVIATLWKVEAGSNSPLPQMMDTFYGEFIRTGDKAAALRAAMLDVSDQFPNPAVWSAFVLIGSPD